MSDLSKPEWQQLMKQGTYALQRGDGKTAVPMLERAYEQQPDNMDVMLNLSSAYILNKQFKQAAEVLEKLTRRDPGNAMFWMNLGAARLGNPVLAKDEQQLSAVKAFKRALKCNPKTPNVAYNIGLIYRDRREYKKAQRWFEQAVELNPDDDHARRYIAQMKKAAADE